jgi:GPH family glycoside/pentoside/hexuronide:cation symporter
LFVIAIYLFSWLGVQITASIIPYFVVNCMKLKEGDVPTVMIAVQGTALFMLFIWSYLSKKIGKKIVYFLGMSSWIIAAAGLFFLQPNQVGLRGCYGCNGRYGSFYSLSNSLVNDP